MIHIKIQKSTGFIAIAICLARELKIFHVGVEIMFYFHAGPTDTKDTNMKHYRYVLPWQS